MRRILMGAALVLAAACRDDAWTPQPILNGTWQSDTNCPDIRLEIVEEPPGTISGSYDRSCRGDTPTSGPVLGRIRFPGLEFDVGSLAFTGALGPGSAFSGTVCCMDGGVRAPVTFTRIE